MSTRFFFAVAALCIFLFTANSIAQEKATDAEKAAFKRGSDDAWSWGNAFVVKNYFDQVYYSHAMDLLNAEKQLRSGVKPADIAKALSALPGVKGAVVLSDSGDAQAPDSLVKVRALSSILFNSATARQGKTLSPMTHRMVGGKVKYQQVPMGDNMLDLLVRYVHKDTLTQIPAAAICLVMDRIWLTAQIPAAMDSLYRENSQLLFCAASPTNHLWEQSLGVIAGKDTLWWTGRKDVKITNVQPIWPFPGVEVYSYVHTLEKK